tara:strand:- start:3768 stop:4046 length:279 start_codon:yes stop_codon:yes gene_type:complete
METNNNTWSLVGYVNQCDEQSVMMALWESETSMPGNYLYFVKHDANPFIKLDIRSSQPLTDRQLVNLKGYKKPFFVNLYKSDEYFQTLQQCN